jgi:hypothetical protein
VIVCMVPKVGKLIVERCLGFVVGVEVDCLALFLAVLFERLW